VRTEGVGKPLSGVIMESDMAEDRLIDRKLRWWKIVGVGELALLIATQPLIFEHHR
jgi:hypothetical protein